MATSHPRQKWFGSSTAHLLTGVLSLWLIYSLGLSLILNFTPAPVSGEVMLDPMEFSKGHPVMDRLPRGLIPLDSADYYDGGSSSYNNPTILEGNNAFETLRQLTDANTESFIRRRLFNTSVALTVPVFSFTLPNRFPEGATIDLANQAIFGVFALLVTFLIFAVPVLFTGVRPYDIFDKTEKGRNNNGEKIDDILEKLMRAQSAHTINFMGVDMQNKVGLNPEKCLQRSICDAFRFPKKYGLFALPFQLLFRPKPPSPDNEDFGKYSIFEMAAQTGEYRKTEKCYEKYTCFFDIMDLAIYLVDYFNPPKDDQTIPQ